MEQDQSNLDQPKRLLNSKDVAARLNVCRKTAYTVMNSGEFDVQRFGASIRVEPAVFDAWLKSKTVKAQAA